MFIKRILLLLALAFSVTGCMTIDVRLDQPIEETKNGLRLQAIAIKEGAYQMEKRLPSDYGSVVQRATDRAHNWRGDAPEEVYEYITLAGHTKQRLDRFNTQFDAMVTDLYHLDINDEDARQDVVRQMNALRRDLSRMQAEGLLMRVYTAAQEINQL